MKDLALNADPMAALVRSELVRLGIPPADVEMLAAADLSCVRSPWAIPGMDKLVERLDAAARRNKRLVLFGDFDTDGTTATAVLFATLARRLPSTRRCNPWFREGYGLHADQVERFAAEGAQVIVTVDNGITAHEAVERARQLGVEVLIVDHHLQRSDIGPPRATTIDPPDNVLSASQVGYLVAQALRELWWGETAHDDAGLALAAVGAQMDWMPLNMAENRGWVAHAQRVINSDACPPGLAAIRRALGQTYAESELLTLGSPLNLGKRLLSVDPNLVTELLLPETPTARRDEIAARLVSERARVELLEKGVHERALSDAAALRRERGLLLYPVESPDDELAELEGPLANILTWATGRPTLTLRRYPDLIAFSGRAAGTFSFASFISDAGLRRVVTNMGGHAKAMGGAFKPERLDDFIAAARAWEKATQDQDIWANTTEPAAPPQDLAHLTPQIAGALARVLGPFGHRFRRPAYRMTFEVRQGRVYYGDTCIHSDTTGQDGLWSATFAFDEALCDGKEIGIRVANS